jgi:Ribbon-helix-helix domain
MRKPGTFRNFYSLEGRQKEMSEKERFTTHLEKRQIEDLKALSRATRITVAVFVREAVDMLLAKYQKELKKTKREK